MKIPASSTPWPRSGTVGTRSTAWIQIRCLDVGGVLIVVHHAKLEALHAFYNDLLGCARPTSWAFNLSALYAGAPAVDASRLIALFTAAEVVAAVAGLDRSSAPAPDGLGPSFYMAAWPVVDDDMMRLLRSYHTGEADLAKINRAHVVLIPSTMGCSLPVLSAPYPCRSVT
jgi:hypothetical protein